MTLEVFFMQIARDKLSAEQFTEIHGLAVAAERRRIERAPVLSKTEQVESKTTALVVGAHLANAPAPKIIPHIAERIEERLDIAVSASDLGDLRLTVKANGPNVHLTKTVMMSVGYYEVAWRGKHFVVIYNKSQDRLITAYPKVGKKTKRLRSGRPPQPRRISVGFEDDLEDALAGGPRA